LSVTAGTVALTKILTKNRMHKIAGFSDKLGRTYQEILEDENPAAK